MYQSNKCPIGASENPVVDDITEVYQTYRQSILAHLVRLVRDHEVAEDLCQETFIKVMRAWSRRDARASISAWIYRIATNTAYDYLRRSQRIRFTPLYVIEQGAFGVDTLDTQLDEHEPIQQALAQLPERYRTLLILHSCAGHSTRELADALGCTDNAIKTRLFRARTRFREIYQHQ
ncbi:MAG: RNA polymerase sigma factor [Chloroflexota bacterium]